ncbi:ArsR/SmtB family transcription factor [Salinibacillus xinjiangensis]|uniref:ArsR family transcriptional regulator n=1 Tax=Salinibacillus xinjiangensis TaxID=1229268 RepID=A0A6G1XB00_9BACI|nr:winged helix-turn-helix domain-containing protein [Salinibacillus xinjiangensis]MRG88117.1 ArsR family transcriptional regulator [Salinibacillus xinjiangensis]
MSFKVEPLFSPVYELLLSFSLYKRQTHLKYLDIGPKWISDVESKISEDLKHRIQAKEELYFEDLSVLLIAQSPVKEDTAAFFKWLKSLSAGDIYNLLTPYLTESMTVPGDLDRERTQFIQLLQGWNEQYFQTLDLGFLEALKHDATRVKHRLTNELPEQVVRSESRFVVETDEFTKVYLIPAYHFQPMSLVDAFEGTLFITYPARTTTHFDEVIRVTKALSDRRRLQILQFLSSQPSTFTDIVKEIGMAKGNIHHHLSVLRAARLIDILLTDDKNTFYYTTHKGFSNELHNEITQLMQVE